MGKNRIILAYIPCPSRKEAKRIANHLLRVKLAACTNIFRIESAYLWKGKIESGKEYLLIAKTTLKMFEALKNEVIKIHPYDIPCVLRISADANEKYFRWLCAELI
jgi:periplasmic divalent cation tolerance protein